MRPKLPALDPSPTTPLLRPTRLGGDARSRLFHSPGGQQKEAARGLTLSTGQSSHQRRFCVASSSPVVYAANTRWRRTTAIPTRLIVPDLKLPFGERIQCVGQSDELGSWQQDGAPILAWTEGDNWVHHLQLPTGHHEFKLLIIRDDGTTHWEQGPNRAIEVPDSIDGIFEVKCQFEFTTGTETGTIPFPVKQQDERAIRQAAADVEHQTSKKKITSEAGRQFQNDIVAQGDLPDALEGESADNEPERLSDAKDTPRRFSWENDRNKDKDKNKEREEAMEGVSPPSSDPLRETEPPADDRSVQSRGRSNLRGPELIVSPHKDSTWSASGQATLANGSSSESIDLSRPELAGITRRAFQANGRPVKMYGGAEAKELEDGSVLVKFPKDNGEDLTTLIERLLGYYEPK